MKKLQSQMQVVISSSIPNRSRSSNLMSNVHDLLSKKEKQSKYQCIIEQVSDNEGTQRGKESSLDMVSFCKF